jgi:flagellar FliJ protein
MSQKLPLDTLIELAQNKADEATRRLGQLQSARNSAAEKLELLHRYRQEYLDQLQTHLQEGVSAAHLRNFRQFISTLDTAIEQQHALTTQADARLVHGRSDWQHTRSRLNSFDTLAERVQLQQAVAENKRAQRDSDEHTARQFYRRSNASAG